MLCKEHLIKLKSINSLKHALPIPICLIFVSALLSLEQLRYNSLLCFMPLGCNTVLHSLCQQSCGWDTLCDVRHGFLVIGMDVWWQLRNCHLLTCGSCVHKSTPYTFPGGTSKIVNHNNARLAEVWLDEWKEFYYSINPG
jgi:hypothetical protein